MRLSKNLCRTTEGVLCVAPECPAEHDQGRGTCNGTDGRIGNCSAACFGMLLHVRKMPSSCKLHIKVGPEGEAGQTIVARRHSSDDNRPVLVYDLTWFAGRSFDLWLGTRRSLDHSPSTWCVLDAAELVSFQGHVLRVRYYPSKGSMSLDQKAHWRKSPIVAGSILVSSPGGNPDIIRFCATCGMPMPSSRASESPGVSDLTVDIAYERMHLMHPALSLGPFSSSTFPDQVSSDI
jgi:hypothetical protein